MHIDQRTIELVLEDWQTAPVSERLRAGLRLVETLTRHPQDLDAAMIGELRAAGVDNAAIEHAANVAFHFNFINRLADAFDFPALEDDQRRRLAKMLDRAGRFVGGSPPEPSWARGADGLLRPVEVDVGREHALSAAGVMDAELRREVEAYAASWFGGVRVKTDAGAELVEPLRVYVEKLARWAYKIIDEDVDALKDAGFSEEAIFELTFAGAMGASVAALECLFEVLYGEGGGELREAS